MIGLIGKVPYLNGGLFDIHELEKDNDKLDVKDEAFVRLFDFFDENNWHLDDRITSSGKDIRGIPGMLPLNLKKTVESGRMLIISPFEKNVTKVTIETASIRNKMMIELADKVIVGYVHPNGNLNQILLNARINVSYL